MTSGFRFLIYSTIIVSLGGCGVGGCLSEVKDKGSEKIEDVKTEYKDWVKAAEATKVEKLTGGWRATLADGKEVTVKNLSDMKFSATVTMNKGNWFGEKSAILDGDWGIDNDRYLLDVKNSSSPDIVPIGVMFYDEITELTDYSFTTKSIKDERMQTFLRVGS